MHFNPDIHHRQSIRLRDYDYSQPGAYFITICTHQRESLFGYITDGMMNMNATGMLVDATWRDLPNRYPTIELGDHVVMPNHFHGIVHILDGHPVGARFIAPSTQFIAPDNCADQCVQSEIQPGTMGQGTINQGVINQGAINRAPTVGNVIRGFKARCTHGVNQLNNTTGQPLWQRNYYEHIIRNEQAYRTIAEYIRSNPQRWQYDVYHEVVSS